MANSCFSTTAPFGYWDPELVNWLEELNDEEFLFLEKIPEPISASYAPNTTFPVKRFNPSFIKSEPMFRRTSNNLSREESHDSAHTDSTTNSNKGLTAMEIFESFTKRFKNQFGEEVIDCSGIISRPCYDLWLSSRKKEPSRPEECFRKCILAHCTASDGGSAPFSPEVEIALLTLLRQPGKVWPCFEGYFDKHGRPLRIGAKGLRAEGYHEKQAKKRDLEDDLDMEPASKIARHD